MFNPIENKNNYQYIVEQIKQMILDNELSIGDKLPTERELSEMYQVSRSSVREALKALEALGLLESRHGGGNYIINNLKEKFSDSLSLIIALDHCKLEDLRDLRYMLEFNTMRHIMQENEPDTMEALTALAEKIEKVTSIEDLVPLDLEFHTLIASLNKNPLEQYIQQSFQTVYLKHIEFLDTDDSSWNGVSLNSAKELQLDIIKVLLSRDYNRLNDALMIHYFHYPSKLDIETLYEKYAYGNKTVRK